MSGRECQEFVSFPPKIPVLACSTVATTAPGADVTQIRLTDLRLPIYDGDAEAENGLPEGAHTLKRSIAEHQALLIATPEHNGGYSALLKNAIDWISRPSRLDRTGLQTTAGKLEALISASPGAQGGLRSQIALQLSLSKLGALVIPDSFALSSAHQAFDEQGRLKDVTTEKMVRAVGAALVKLATRLEPF